MKFSNINKLCELKKSFSFSEEADNLFVAAMKENYEFQLERQPFIKYLAERESIRTKDIKTSEDIYSIPPLFVGTMKYNGFCSVSKEQLAAVLTSSGTKGQKTQSFFDEGSMKRLQSLALNTFESMGYKSHESVHYFAMAYDINKAKDVGTSWSDDQMMSLAPAKSKHWTIEWDDVGKRFYFDANKWARLFIELAHDAPIRLLGFPSYMYQMIEEIKRIHGRIKLHKDSFILAGGGWKNHLGKTMTLKEFSSYTEENIGLGLEGIGDTFGMAEHGVPYCSCSHGNYHIPIYSRALVRNPITMEVKEQGEEGILQLFTPYNTAQPNLSLLSTDIAIIEENCPCKIEGKYIASVRRGGIRKHAGCAIAAQEILNNSRKEFVHNG